MAMTEALSPHPPTYPPSCLIIVVEVSRMDDDLPNSLFPLGLDFDSSPQVHEYLALASHRLGPMLNTELDVRQLVFRRTLRPTWLSSGHVHVVFFNTVVEF